MTKTSRLSGFHQLTHKARLSCLQQQCGLSDTLITHLENTGNLDYTLADNMVENVVGTMNIPLGIATNMIVNHQEVLIPMATEESSVVAAVCNAAKQCRSLGGFSANLSGNIMIAQIQLTDIPNPETARLQILSKQNEIQAICDSVDPMLCKLGGGFRDVEVHVLYETDKTMVITHLLVDTCDAMGANAVNSMAEAVSPLLAEWTGGCSVLRILSNLADRRLARTTATWDVNDIGGEDVRDRIIDAYQFAENDPYRAATHNKGIMNGISAVVLATGNDTRAVEAGAHAYAVRNGSYRSLSHWEVDKDGNLCGALELPLAVGLVGGATKVHPTAQAALAILGVKTAAELASLIASVGLAQNFAALKALATTGIQKGHMTLHARNIAIMAGAVGEEIAAISQQMINEGTIRVDAAENLLSTYRNNA